MQVLGFTKKKRKKKRRKRKEKKERKVVSKVTLYCGQKAITCTCLNRIEGNLAITRSYYGQFAQL
jgi:hypothetical protein